MPVLPALPYVFIFTALFFAGFGMLAGWWASDDKDDQFGAFACIFMIGIIVGLGMQAYANAYAPDPDCICESQP